MFGKMFKKAPPPSAQVYVVRYDPTTRWDLDHWVIYVHGPGEKKSFHRVVDDFAAGGYGVAHTRFFISPEKESLFKEEKLVGHLSSSVVSQARDLILNHPVDDKRNSFNCQSWVMEVLTELQDKRYIQLESGVMNYLEGKLAFRFR